MPDHVRANLPQAALLGHIPASSQSHAASVNQSRDYIKNTDRPFDNGRNFARTVLENHNRK